MVSGKTESSSGQDEALTENQKVWRTLQEHLRDEDFDKALQLANAIRSKSADDVDAIRVKCLCLINQDKYDKALQSASGKNKAILAPERAYCLFRLQRNEEALEVARSALAKGSFDGTRRGKALMHLKAQALYRLARHAEAAELYSRIVEEEEKEEERRGHDGAGTGDRGVLSTVSVNLVAAHAAAGAPERALEAFPIEEALEEDGVPWELLYNLGTASMQRGARADLEAAEKCLVKAGEACREALIEEGQGEDEARDESAIVMSQLACTKGRAGRQSEAVEGLKEVLLSGPSDATVTVVSTANLAALDGYKDQHEALERFRFVLGEKWEKGLLPNQAEACRVSLGLLLLKCGKLEECAEALGKIKELYPASDVPPRLEAALLSRRGKGAEALGVLRERLADAKAGSQQELALKLALCQLQASRGDLASAAELLGGVDALRGTPAAAAALARLYAGMGRSGDAASAVEEAVEAAYRGDHGLQGETKAAALLGMANWLQDEGFHRQAAAAYSKLLDLGAELDSDVRVQAQASLVIALSHFDSQRAEEEARKLPYMEDLGSAVGLNPADLEASELPRSSRARKLVVVDKASIKAERKQKSDHEAVLRKRARRREKYLAKLVADGKIDPNKPAPRPDPERWIPRSHRSYNKRGRKRNKFVGAQGSGDGAAKDAAKLDVHARTQAKQEVSSREQTVLPPGVVGKRGGKRR